MTLKDINGLALTGASDVGRAHFETALAQLQCYRGDPVASIDQAIAADPGFALAHAFKAWLHLLGTEPSGFDVAEQCNFLAGAAAGTDREKGHVAAIGHLLDGRWHEAGRVLEDVTIACPRDGLALLAGHQIDFFTGQSRMLRDRIARALPDWDEGRPGYHSLLGMLAFGLEETGHFTAAEAAGRRGVELEPRNGWSQHAVAHVLEMRNRPEEGIAWMRGNDGWAQDSFLAVHNWWHLALYHLELGDIATVLALFDERIAGGGSTIMVELVDASAMLWRLTLRGVDVAARWDVIADRWLSAGLPGLYAFNDMHMVMALVGAGRRAAAVEVLDGLRDAQAMAGDNAGFSRDVGCAAASAMLAFGDGDYAGCAALLRQVRPIAHRFGGSHAQRDVLDLTLIEAALRGGQAPLARALAAERLAARHESPLAQLFHRRAATLAA